MTKTQYGVIWFIVALHLAYAFNFHAQRAWRYNQYERYALNEKYNGSNQGILSDGEEYLYYYPPMVLYVMTAMRELLNGKTLMVYELKKFGLHDDYRRWSENEIHKKVY